MKDNNKEINVCIIGGGNISNTRHISHYRGIHRTWVYITGNHLILTSEHTVNIIEQKARNVLGILKRGVKFIPMQPDVISILEKVKEKK